MSDGLPLGGLMSAARTCAARRKQAMRRQPTEDGIYIETAA